MSTDLQPTGFLNAQAHLPAPRPPKVKATTPWDLPRSKTPSRLLPYDIKDVDLIVSASYSPYDTVATLAHLAQQKYDIDGAKAVYASAACSSFVNGLEIVEGYFASGKATKALLVCSEHNTYYSNESDPKAGHLWGDAAVAFFLSKDPVTPGQPEIKAVYTCGLGNVSKGPEGVRRAPKKAVSRCQTDATCSSTPANT